MAARRNDDKARELYAIYQSGSTLRQIGEQFAISNQTIHSMFSRRGWPLRNKKASHHQFLGGKKYAKKPSGYYGATDRSRTLMHRDVWASKNGEIPAGHQIHHMDGNRGNNSLENLLLVDAADHSRRHMAAKMHLHECPHCGGNLFPK